MFKLNDTCEFLFMTCLPSSCSVMKGGRAATMVRHALQALLVDGHHVTADPREADLFLVPAMFCELAPVRLLPALC